MTNYEKLKSLIEATDKEGIMTEIKAIYKCNGQKPCNKSGSCHVNGGQCFLTTEKEYAKREEKSEEDTNDNM